MTTPTQEQVPPLPREDTSSPLGVLLKRLSDQVSALVRGEIDLAVAKAKGMATKLGTGGALLAVVGVFALYLLGLFMWAGVYGFANLYAGINGAETQSYMWAGVLTVAAILLLIMLILAAIGMALIKKGQKDKPDPKAGMEAGIASVKKGLGK